MYGRKKYSSARGKRSSARKYSRKPRGRFSRKRFTKVSSKQRTVVKAPVNARETYVKLPWVNTFPTLTVGSLASVSYAFLGNSLIPSPTVFTGTITAGDEWVSGVSEYANFYNQYRVLGSSIKVQIVMQTTAVVGCTIIPVMMGGTESGSTGIPGRITELDALTYDQLSMQPSAQMRMLGIGTGGNATVFFKMFRKTKQMLACKDIKDNEDTLCRLPDPTGTNGNICVTDNNSFFYYIRITNLTSTASVNYNMQIKMKYYTQLTGRTNWSTVSVPA